MKFTKLEVENFRHITHQTIEIGSVITAIAGQNGTGKSTLLGWIAQSSDFKIKIRLYLNHTLNQSIQKFSGFVLNKTTIKNTTFLFTI